MYIYRLQHMWRDPLAFCFPLLTSLCSPFYSPLLTWNPPCCDRIRPPWSQVARKLISPFPSLPISIPPHFHPSPFPPHSEIPTPWGFPVLNAPLQRQHRNTGLQVQNMSNDGHGTWTRDTRYWTTTTPHLHFSVWSHWWKIWMGCLWVGKGEG
jgi:hypothetical protein